MPIAELKLFDVPFPMRGVHESSGQAQQPAGTSPYARNVRGYDPVDKRDRGAQRAGIQKYIDEAQDDGPIEALATRIRVNPNAVFQTALWSLNPATLAAGDHVLDVPTSPYEAYRYNVTTSRFFPVSTGLSFITLSAFSQPYGSYIFTGTLYGHSTKTTSSGHALAVFSIVDPLATFLGGGTQIQYPTFSEGLHVYVYTDGCRAGFQRDQSDVIASAQSFTAFGNNVAMPFTITITKDTITVAITGRPTKTFSNAGPDTWDFVTGIYQAGVDLNYLGFNTGGFGVGTLALTAADSTDFSVVAEEIAFAQNGQIYVGDSDSGFTVQDAALLSGAVAYTRGEEISIIGVGSNFYLASANWPLRQMTVTGGNLCQQPNVEVTVPPCSYPSSGTSGQYAQLLAIYQDRLFHGRFRNAPYEYMASKAGSYRDYNFADLTARGAFAGSNAQQASQLGDILTAMIPFGDQSMVMGMANTIGIMRGNIKSGGVIDTASREVGIVSPHAWARTPDDDLFFMGRDGLYRLDGRALRAGGSGSPSDGLIKAISRGRLDTTLGRINWKLYRVIMTWDPQELGVKIYLLPPSYLLPTTVIYWEQRKDAFWIDTYPGGIGPRVALTSRGRGPDSVVVMGCQDGLLRALDLAAVGNDDGFAIASRVDYTPQQFNGPMLNSKIAGTRLLFSDNGSNFSASYSLMLGDDPVTAAAADPTVIEQVPAAGYQTLIRSRARGACAIVRIENSTLNRAWSIENVSLLVAPSGRVRT